MKDILNDVISRNRAGDAIALPSVCTAHAEALRASLLLAEELDHMILIEATSNQANQDGGYTGMKPADFVSFVHRLADADGIDRARIVFGGDHLGPIAWRGQPADQAMAKAHRLVADYVSAGFTKIHLDCSEGCLGEETQVGDDIAAARAADLARTCTSALPENDDLVFVIGTEVPPPGGARCDDEGAVTPTDPKAAAHTLAAHRTAFNPEDFDRVSALVVQPGLEFTPMRVHALPLDRDPGLREVMLSCPNLVLEAHSTDYQRAEVYPYLAQLGFAFQKVGPALTFAYRQAIYALDLIAGIEGIDTDFSVRLTMEGLMREHAGYWQGHYHGDAQALAMQRHFAWSDRIRYYWPMSEAVAAVERLQTSLAGRNLPEPLLRQVFAADIIARAEALRSARHLAQAEALVLASIQEALHPYFFGAAPQKARHGG